MEKRIKVVLPMAGLGKRLRPHTLYRPKPLVSLAGKTILDFVLDQFSELLKAAQVEFAFIVGHKGELIKDYMDEHYPEYNVSYFYQKEMLGQSDAVYTAKDFISGPTLIAFGDTITDPDLTVLIDKKEDGNIIWAREVDDVRELGVVQVSGNGCAEHLYEKPKAFVSSTALVGFYYLDRGEDLLSAIEEQYRLEKKLNNEYYLADAVNILIDRGATFRIHPVNLWLDAGRIDTLLATNAYLLGHGIDNSKQFRGKYPTSSIVPPVFIGENVHIHDSTVGPNVVIEPGCRLDHVTVHDAIIQKDMEIKNMVLEQSIIGPSQVDIGVEQ